MRKIRRKRNKQQKSVSTSIKGPKSKGHRTQRVPQESILEWARDILERRQDEPYDTTGDITKKVRMKVLDFEGRVDPMVFSNWIASIEEFFDWYDMEADR